MTEKQLKDLRKAYFLQNLDSFLDQCLAEGAGEEFFEEVTFHLEQMSSQAEKLKKGVAKFAKVEEFKPPSVEELMGIDEDRQLKIMKWEADKEADYDRARELIDLARQATKQSRVPAQDWLSWGLELATLQYSLDQYRVWKDQQYRKRLTQIIDAYGVSRAEAEERAKLTPEYRYYKEAVLFREMTEETIKILKKWAGLYE